MADFPSSIPVIIPNGDATMTVVGSAIVSEKPASQNVVVTVIFDSSDAEIIAAAIQNGVLIGFDASNVLFDEVQLENSIMGVLETSSVEYLVTNAQVEQLKNELVKAIKEKN